jgi:hypothetical protein
MTRIATRLEIPQRLTIGLRTSRVRGKSPLPRRREARDPDFPPLGVFRPHEHDSAYQSQRERSTRSAADGSARSKQRHPRFLSEHGLAPRVR